jgi:hypothetical protein
MADQNQQIDLACPRVFVVMAAGALAELTVELQRFVEAPSLTPALE